jgi:hypothetical protein
MKTPEHIWLIDMGDAITWCDCPDPSDDIDDEDVVEYVKYETYEKLRAENEQLRKAITDCIDYANGRESEWGNRAITCFGFLEDVLE